MKDNEKIVQDNMELNDDDLEGVAGGMNISVQIVTCRRHCGFSTVVDNLNPIPPSRCPDCGYEVNITKFI